MTHKFEILVVDDDLKNIQVGINFLKQNEDYHMVFATTGQQAIERVKEMDFDLVLLDIIMPVMDGYEVCRQLKADPRTKNIPVIFLTAKHEADSLMKGFELGGADYVTKPFNAPELNARVKTHLELHHHYKKEIAKLEEVLGCSQDVEVLKFVTSGVTHDCNNFMAFIPPSTHMLQSRLMKNGVDIEPYQDLFAGINTAVEKVTELLQHLSRFTLQKSVAWDVVDLNEVVDDIKKIYKSGMNHKISFAVEFLSQPALAMSNKLHIEQVLLNMLINAQHAVLARKYPEGEGARIRLTIDKTTGSVADKLSSHLDYLCLEVVDNGVGMPPEIMEMVFDKYFTTRKELGGSGLGLAVSQSIVNSYNGCIQVESELGKGTTFKIYLPFYHRPAAVSSFQLRDNGLSPDGNLAL